MRNTFIIAAKELKSYLTSPMVYIIVAIFLIGTGFFFINFGAFEISPTFRETSLRGFFGYPIYTFIILLLIAVLTMRLLAEEKKLGTIELLMTAPVRDSEIILGKFLGSLGIVVLMLVLTFYYPILLAIFGDPDFGPIASGYLGLFLLCCASLAIGIFASASTSNQIIAAVVGGAILLGLWFLGAAADYLPEGIGSIASYFSLSNYFRDFTIGIIDTRGIVYYLCVTILFLFLAVRSLENSRWS